jgi:hypothetical protein
VNHGELNRLETEVEAARARLTADLKRLRAPETFSRFKGELAAEVEHTKDEWIAKAKDTVNERTTSILDDLKARAAANPLAAVSIGAGLIWYLVRHPPIATILVGLGVYGLIRTNPNEPDVVSPVWSRAQELAASAANTVNELAEETREAINHASDIAGSISNRAADVAGAFANRGAEVAEAVADSRTGIAHSAKDKLETWTEPRRESGAEAVFRLKTRTDDLTRTAQTAISVASNNRDTVLLGAAAVALVAAIGMAYGRQTPDTPQRTRESLSL